MSRFIVSRWTKSNGKFLLLLGALLMSVYLCTYFIHHKTIDLQYVINSGSQIKVATRNSSVYLWPKCQRNESAANATGFSTFTEDFKNFLYYQHCRHYPIILENPDKCGGANKSADVFLLLVIKSAPKNYNRREALRKTWAKERSHNGLWIRRLFIVGTMNPGLEGDNMNKLLMQEQREYNDILQWDFKDSFYNLTVKQILFLEWMETNCPHARFVLDGDDDVFANTDNMVNFLSTLKDNDGSKHLFIGNLMVYSGPIRIVKSKYFVSVDVFRLDYFPPYCSGGGYILSSYTAKIIYNMSKSINIIPIDDAYMGMCMEKAGVGPSSHIGVQPYGWRLPSKTLDQYDPCLFKDALLVHGFLPFNMFLTWQRIQDPNLKCSNSKKMVTEGFKW